VIKNLCGGVTVGQVNYSYFYNIFYEALIINIILRVKMRNNQRPSMLMATP